ncbi:MAG: hypothetical protein OXI39_02780 [Gemmatimonadota bacterium]|uniref:hypothetical protein n=1 Tax=Candidatus Palauibacter scopulicola TaxID=3056741 RepID=UPI00238E32C3|nr:hypothetical protein [Candidatus Palauibacter scopulicola]MDE2661917.1 hypothetical protein [Candidatus Palauibacter scopulicola]
MLKDRMDDASRFARFVRREAADYHDPPEAPAEAMWAGIEARLGAAAKPVSPGVTDDASDAAVDLGDGLPGAGGVVDRPFDVLGYHDPPPAPREAMWERIEAEWEAEWVARQPEDPGARTAARGPLRLVVARTFGRRPGRTTVWLTGAVAASVALAVALDRGAQLPVLAEPETVAATTTAPTTAAPVTAAPMSVAATDSGPLAPTAAEEALALSVLEEPLETNRQFAAADPPPAAAPAATPGRPEADPPLRDAAAEYDMSRISRHLDRTQALLVAFRTDIGTDESQRDLARWAREFLVETRSLLSTPAAEGQRERALLQDLELVLVQIARLGPDAPDFERELARESVERQGTLMRLRSVSGT